MFVCHPALILSLHFFGQNVQNTSFVQLYSSILWLIFSLMAQSVQMPTSHNTQHTDFTSCSGSIKSRFTFSVQSNCARVHLKVRPPCLGLGTGSFDRNPSAIVVFSPDRMRKCGFDSKGLNSAYGKQSLKTNFFTLAAWCGLLSLSKTA